MGRNWPCWILSLQLRPHWLSRLKRSPLLLRLMRGKLVTKNSGATASYISGLAQVIVMIDEPRSLAKAKSALFRSIKPIKQAGEISTRLATVSVCCQRLPFVRASVERSSPIQKMNLSAQRIRHSQVHLPNVSAKYRVR